MTGARAHGPDPMITVAFAEYSLPPSSAPSSALPFRSGENKRQRAQDLTASRHLHSSSAQTTTSLAEGLRGAVPLDTPRSLRAKVEFAFDAAIVAHGIEAAGTSLDKKTAELEKIVAVLTKWHTRDLAEYIESEPANGAVATSRWSAQDQAFYKQVLKTMGNSIAIMAELLISPLEDMANDILESGTGHPPSHGLINAIRAKLGSHRYHQELYEWDLKRGILPNFEKELDELLTEQNLDTIKALAFAARVVQPATNAGPPPKIVLHLQELLLAKCGYAIF